MTGQTITTAAEHDAPRLYVAGPMTGLPDHNYPAFDQAAGALRGAGFTVENPADNTVTTGDYHDYLRAGLAQLLRCGGVATLEGWWASGGARWEVQTAGILGLPVRPVADWLDMGAAAELDAHPADATVREVWRAAWEACSLRSGVGCDKALNEWRPKARQVESEGGADHA